MLLSRMDLDFLADVNQQGASGSLLTKQMFNPKNITTMTLKHFKQALIIIFIFIAECVFMVGFFVLMAIIIFGMMAGCSNAQEFIHIFI